MSGKVNIFTAIIVIIVGLYDISIAINRRHQPNNRNGIKAYAILGGIFTVFGIGLLISLLIQK